MHAEGARGWLPGSARWALLGVVLGLTACVPSTAVGGLEPQEALRCAGAASMDAENPCVNPAYGGGVQPGLDAALLASPTPTCTPLPAAERTPPVCAFGVPRGAASGGTVALIGDSHAESWRVALADAAAAQRWYGLSRARSGCPFSTLVLDNPRSMCGRTVSSTRAWLAARPEISTVIVAGRATSRASQAPFEARVQAADAALDELPPSVEHVVVIRDNPVAKDSAQVCIDAVVASLGSPGLECASPPRTAVKRDPLAEAATRKGSERFQVVDLTPLMCSARLCRPVIGGLVVHRDGNHLTEAFVRTLGPYLERSLTRLAASWG